MAAKPPARNTLYTIPEASKRWKVPLGMLYGEIAAGRLRAKMRRGNVRGYFVTDQIMDDWIDNSLVDVYEALHGEAIA